MNQSAAPVRGTGLRDFCTGFLNRFGKEAVHDPEILATEFRRFFGINGAPRLLELRELALNELGISEIGPHRLPGGVRGRNIKCGDHISLVYSEHEWDGAQEFTFGHELREIIGKICEEIDPQFADVEGEEREMEADSFSASLLMDKNEFYTDMEASGYDPIWLHEKYHKSYTAIISRMAAVLQPVKGHFWGAVFEFGDKTPAGFALARCFHRSPRYVPKARYLVPNFFFPKRDQLVPLKNNLEVASARRRPVHIQQLKGLDFWERYCLSVLIRPVMWGETVAKLIIIAVPYKDREKLQKQLLSILPIMVEESFQFI